MKTNDHGFVRVAAVSPEMRVADVAFNAQQHARARQTAERKGASVVVFPELSLTGYTCADLFSHSTLLHAAEEALAELVRKSQQSSVVSVVGLPVALRGRTYNCAAVYAGGELLGIVPKTFLPTTGEFYEERWFTGADHLLDDEITLAGQTAPIGANLLFSVPGTDALLGVEICEDLWATKPPSSDHALAGANIIVNPSASNELLGKAPYRRDLVKQQSARCLSAYVYASAGPGESSTDIVYSGHCLIAENGQMLADSQRFQFDTQITLADLDVQRLSHERATNSSFSAATTAEDYRLVSTDSTPTRKPSPKLGELRPHSALPFVPSDPKIRAETCEEIFAIQSTGLMRRLRHLNLKNVVLGISGGLDSTLALLVTVHAFDQLGLDRQGIIAPTMPGPGTSRRTKGNAEKLVEALGATLLQIPIGPAVKQHFKDIGHDPDVHNVTFENTQARERTQILMDLANKHGGLVVGTGDLSESALGWCTFNGDHMSMYHVNVGVPKTLVRYMIDWCAETEFSGASKEALLDIADTPISPELLPTDKKGQISQETESLVGPYALHDFFLYHFVRHGVGPAKMLFIAQLAFGKKHPRAEILKWMEVFVRRFFGQQFKRSALPDGPKVGTVALSPRGDWRMPSDASAGTWLAQIKTLKAKR